MNEQDFWKIIDGINGQSFGDMDKKCELLKKVIEKLDSTNAIQFCKIFDKLMDRAYAWNLWGAAYIINGGCSDDSFNDFRSSLISQGKAIYEKALLDPDSLSEVELNNEDWCYEGFQYAVTESVEAVADTEFDHSALPKEPHGKEWDEEELDKLFPKLTSKYV